jgi:UDP-N-acetylglucosamine 2-epimerase (non-hydrolysing)
MEKINILIAFGTRPEGIKLAPVIKLIEKKKDKFNLKVCSTGQHKEMLGQVLDIFEIKPDIFLDLMTENQTLSLLSSKIFKNMGRVISDTNPDIVLVQGDTTTAFLTSLIAFYGKIKIGHVEAGLRTYDKYNPFPEEINRQLISRIADFNFAPTKKSFINLISEGINRKTIFMTGNTIVDTLMWITDKIERNKYKIRSNEIFKKLNNYKTILVTMHRRESFGKDLENVCCALKAIASKYNDIKIVYPVHLNPNVRKPVFKILSGIDNIILTEPLDYISFIWLMHESFFIITDSGGIQEEAPTFRKPVLVIRNKTERTESTDIGISKLIGTSIKSILDNASKLIDDKNIYDKMTAYTNPYGDGKASEKIIDIMYNNLQK